MYFMRFIFNFTQISILNFVPFYVIDVSDEISCDLKCDDCLKQHLIAMVFTLWQGNRNQLSTGIDC